MSTAATAALTGGFANPPVDAAHAFRATMDVMARPGEIRQLTQARPPAPLSVAAGTLILTLCDPETGLHLAGAHDTKDVRDWVAFHTGAPIVPAEAATFALGTWKALSPISRFPVGTAEYPDRSATLIVERAELGAAGATLQGPGIRETATLDLPEVAAFAANHRLYPLGLDFFFTAGSRVAALPRSTAVMEG
ncbi:phosphonate C-P lyase system protein PhnH [Marinibacterium profundimaris]|uniref:Carbon-phosphorus lyase n=1 Tax=Marinibacterium profundimaris TaxID=1679460 RepID=A0A225ND26_9RHOB|nr:phosphonate C-P lyase system protein PhnH [Marinibacterium profundimaris]OWU69516.1 carbon-phosphorus lyase [Marinibacterium profundimaris]